MPRFRTNRGHEIWRSKKREQKIHCFQKRIVLDQHHHVDGIEILLAPETAVTVGMPVTQHPPYRSVRAALPHTAPTLGTWRRIARWDTGAGSEHGDSINRPVDRSAPRSDDACGSGDVAQRASVVSPGFGTLSRWPCCPGTRPPASRPGR